MSAQSINVLTVWTDAITELREAAAEYLANSRVLSAECAPTQARLEQALSQFTDHAQVAPRDYRGMEGRIRELEAELQAAGQEKEAFLNRLARIAELLYLTSEFTYGKGPDPIEAQVREALASMQPTKSKRGAK